MIAASMRRGGLRASLWPGKLVFVFLLKSEMDRRNHTLPTYQELEVR